MNEQLANIKFVEEVEKHELLYNYNLSGYSRRDLTEKAWHEIAAKVNMTGIYVKNVINIICKLYKLYNNYVTIYTQCRVNEYAAWGKILKCRLLHT